MFTICGKLASSAVRRCSSGHLLQLEVQAKIVVPCSLIHRLMSSAVTTTPGETLPDQKVEAVAPVKKKKKPYEDNHPGLMEFFDIPKNWGEQEIRSGRPWKKEELRIKSNADLHKLWYVLLKERNMLLTMKEVSDEEFEMFPSPERIDKVEESMIHLEDVVRERNKVYWELEVGEGETGERRRVFRRDMFGRHRTIGCSEHLIPYWMNSPWRKLYGPGYGKDVNDFIALLRERDIRWGKQRLLHEFYHVRQLLRRFPDMDLDYVQERYPRVPVKYLKEYLFKYRERRILSQGTVPRGC